MATPRILALESIQYWKARHGKLVVTRIVHLLRLSEIGSGHEINKVFSACTVEMMDFLQVPDDGVWRDGIAARAANHDMMLRKWKKQL
jgi:hypothetical protein